MAALLSTEATTGVCRNIASRGAAVESRRDGAWAATLACASADRRLNAARSRGWARRRTRGALEGGSHPSVVRGMVVSRTSREVTPF